MSQRTFSIIKPDAVRKGYTAAILASIEEAGFKIVSIKRMSISKAQAEGFYYVHAARPFFGELTEFMSSGPIFPMPTASRRLRNAYFGSAVSKRGSVRR